MYVIAFVVIASDVVYFVNMRESWLLIKVSLGVSVGVYAKLKMSNIHSAILMVTCFAQKNIDKLCQIWLPSVRNGAYVIAKILTFRRECY